MVAFLARRYAEPVDVLRADEAPAHFLWRGRHYTVREVLAHWLCTGPWWERVTALAMASEPSAPAPASDPLRTTPLPPAPRWGQRAWGEPAPEVGAVAAPGGIDDDEREFWRVEASAGRCGLPVVVELCFTWSSASWLLTAVMD